MKPTPPGWPRISSSLIYDDANKAIEWLGKAFGFTVRLKVEDEKGGVAHSELTFGDGVIMVSSAKDAGARGIYKTPAQSLRRPRRTASWCTSTTSKRTTRARPRPARRSPPRSRCTTTGQSTGPIEATARSTSKATAGGSANACAARLKVRSV